MTVRGLAFTLVFACAWSTGALAHATELTVEARPGAVVGLDAKGAVRWTSTHGALGEGKKTPDTPVGPVTLGARTFYAIVADLLELDAAAGQVVRRVRFPAPIVALAARATPEPALLVTVGGKDRHDQMVIAYRATGASPGRGAWGNLTISGAFKDARTLVSGFTGANAASLAQAARDEAIATFERAEARDRTNPFLPALRGRLLAAAGRPADAARAFDSAADLPAASWVDLLSVSSTLEIDDAREPARRAFSRGLAGMKDAGVRPERLNTLIAPLVLLMPPRDKLKQIAEVGDVPRLDEVASRLLAVSPRAEHLDRACAAVAAWMRAKGRQDLAAKWDERAVAAQAGLYRVGQRTVEQIDPVIPFGWAACVFMIAVPLVAGLRAGAGITPDVRGWRRWLPRPRTSDLIAFGLVVLLLLSLLLYVGGREGQLVMIMEAPSALVDDAVAAPIVERWLAARPPSAAREQWLEYARREAAATREGGKYAGPPPDDAAYVALVTSVPLETSLKAALAADLLGGRKPFAGFAVIVFAVGAVLAYVIAVRVGRALPLTSTVLTWLVPGGPAPLGAAGGLIGVLVLAAALSLAGFGHILQTIATPTFASIVGVPYPPSSLPKPMWPWLALTLCLAAHAAAVWRDRGRARVRRRNALA